MERDATESKGKKAGVMIWHKAMVSPHLLGKDTARLMLRGNSVNSRFGSEQLRAEVQRRLREDST